ncbi:MAG: hypothetical protein WBP45_02850 [Daejeonella sp.]
MAEIRSIGLESIKLGEIPVDGTMSTVLAVLGLTYQDSADLVEGDAQSQEIFSEELDDPIEILETKGVKTLKWSIMDFTPDVLAEVLGGTVTGVSPDKVWDAPDETVNIERSVEIITKRGVKIEIPRAKISAKLNMPFRKRGILLVDITARVLKPNSAVAPLSISKV